MDGWLVLGMISLFIEGLHMNSIFLQRLEEKAIPFGLSESVCLKTDKVQ